MGKEELGSGAATRLIIISNRLPVSLERVDGTLEMRASSGGLVTAMGPVLQNRGGLWIGWPGVLDVDETEVRAALGRKQTGYTLRPVMLTEEEHNKFYYGFSNEVIWPLFHELPYLYNYDPDYWASYQEVNRRFARVIRDNLQADDYVWVQDYHLMNVAQELRALGVTTRLGFFLHIPFPPVNIFKKLPWCRPIIRALLEYDLLGFQTARHRRNFLQCVRSLVPEAKAFGKGSINTIRFDGREIRAGSFPVSIDYHAFSAQAASEEVAALVRQFKGNMQERCLVLGVDRLDYTKGIPYKLQAFGLALERYPELIKRITLLQVVVPSREQIPRYFELKVNIERLVGEINGRFTESGWVPIHYMFRSLRRPELLAYYRSAEVALITPLEDGMNLVAKEYCASSSDGNGTLVLSEFAGAATQLQRGAILVNPFDLEGVAKAIYDAYRMDPVERRYRMRRLQRSIREQDIYWWVDQYLWAGAARDLGQYPTLEEAEVGEEELWWSSG